MSLGYGTDYERLVLKGLAKKICQKYQILSSREFPKSKLLGRQPIFPKQKRKPDLVWNFCEFENQKDGRKFIQKMEDLSQKYLLIITQNYLNPGVPLHFLYHFISGRKWNHGDLKKMSYRSVLKAVANNKDLKLIEIGAFDIPWFILDVYETGKYFRNWSVLKEKNKVIRESSFEKWPLFFKLIFAHHHFVLLEKVHS